MNKLVFLASQNPFPANSGGNLRNSSLIKLLRENFLIKLLYLEKNRDSLDPEDLRVESIYIKREPTPHWKKILYPFRPYVANGFSQNVVKNLSDSYSDGAILWISRLALAQYIAVAKRIGYRVILDQENVESDLMSELGRGSFLAHISTAQLRFYERKFCLQADQIVVTSACDKNKIQDLTGREALQISNLIDAEKYLKLDAQAAQKELLFVGTLDYEPNKRGLDWFFECIFPEIFSLIDTLNWNIKIVGARPADALKEKLNKPRVQLLANVPSVLPHLEKASIVFVPLLNGGGTRLKILEAFAAGKAVVSTPKGAEGIEGLVHKENIWFAESPMEFAEGLKALITDQNLRNQLGANAQKLATKCFDWQSARPQITQLLSLFRDY